MPATNLTVWRGPYNAEVARSFTIRNQIVVYAPIERCFLFSTNIEIVEQELKIAEGEE